MRCMAFVTVGLFLLMACATAADSDDDPGLETPHAEDAGGAPIEDAGWSEGDVSVGDMDADRPLACGEAGFCETRLPRSSLGMPFSVRGVWSVRSNDVWSVTAEGAVLHYDGTSWSIDYQVSCELRAVWATASSVWVGGEGGLLLRRSAEGRWSRIETGHLTTIVALYGTSDGDVWLTSRPGFVDHFDGTAVTSWPLHVPDLELTTVFGRPGVGTYAAGLVKGASPSVRNKSVVEHMPYVFELGAGGATNFNGLLSETTGFVPVAGSVTDLSDSAQRVLVYGYIESQRVETEMDGLVRVSNYDVYASLLGRDSAVTLFDTSDVSVLTVSSVSSVETSAKTASWVLPTWIPKWDSYYALSQYRLFTVRWTGRYFRDDLLNMGMGYDYTPRDGYGVHGDLTNIWIVGDGFAVKGPTP